MGEERMNKRIRKKRMTMRRKRLMKAIKRYYPKLYKTLTPGCMFIVTYDQSGKHIVELKVLQNIMPIGMDSTTYGFNQDDLEVEFNIHCDSDTMKAIDERVGEIFNEYENS